MLTVSLIIPTLNEAKNLPYVLPEIPRLPEIAEILLVDGHSTDGTVEVAVGLRSDIRIVAQAGRGKSDAIRSGIAAATSSHVLIMDADGSQDPHEITSYVQKASEGYDLVKGSRYIPGGQSDDDSKLRRLLVWVTDTVSNLLWGSRFTDIVYGMFLINRRACLELDLTSNGFGFETMLMARAHRKRLRTIEIPAVEAARRHGSSHLSVVRDGWHIGSTVFVEFGHRLTHDMFRRRVAPASVGTEGAARR